MSNKSVRRSINLTPEIHEQLAQVGAKLERGVSEADLMRDAIRQYLDRRRIWWAAVGTSRSRCRRGSSG